MEIISKIQEAVIIEEQTTGLKASNMMGEVLISTQSTTLSYTISSRNNTPVCIISNTKQFSRLMYMIKYSRVCCSDADNIRNIWRCLNNSRLPRIEAPDFERKSRETAAYNLKRGKRNLYIFQNNILFEIISYVDSESNINTAICI